MTSLGIPGAGDGFLSSVAHFSIFGARSSGLSGNAGFFADELGSQRQRSWIVEIYDELRPSLYRYLLCVGLSAQEADDVIQDAFLQLFSQLKTKGKPDNAQGWIFRVAQNLSRNLQTRERRLISETEDVSLRFAGRPDPSMNPEEAYLWDEHLRRLAGGMEQLTDQQRQCLHLRAEGLRYREIAESLGISVTRVSQLLQRAVSRLAEGGL